MDNTAVIRLSVFLGVFVLMAVLEALLPAREAVLSRKTRWLGNLSMVVMGALVSRILLPATLVGVSLWAQQKGIGVFNVLLDAVPADASSSNQLLNSGEPLNNSSTYLVHIAIVTLSVLLLDMLIYWQHRLFHTVPMLWRFHKMHHADSHVDTTTGLRFHPVEIAMSLGIKAGAVVILGVPAIAIIIFEVALNGFALFNHANIRLPQKWDDRIGTTGLAYRGGIGCLIVLRLALRLATKHCPLVKKTCQPLRRTQVSLRFYSSHLKRGRHPCLFRCVINSRAQRLSLLIPLQQHFLYSLVVTA